MPVLKIAIARGIRETDIIPAFEACVDGGFQYLEITMNSENADTLIKKAAIHFKSRAVIGAGTVTSREKLNAALKAGAEFIVAPNTDEKIIRFCRKRDIPIYPGALTPTEILRAWEMGASMVKVFPIGCVGGAAYVKEIKGPFDGIKILACGGVTPENLKDYIKNGTDGFAVGSQLFQKEWLEKKQYHLIMEKALKFSID